MIKYYCDFNGCNNVVEDQRKIHISRQNPWDVYFKFHICNNHQSQLEDYVTDKLRKNTNYSNTVEKIYNLDSNKPF
jgi:hypothetical protein